MSKKAEKALMRRRNKMDAYSRAIKEQKNKVKKPEEPKEQKETHKSSFIGETKTTETEEEALTYLCEPKETIIGAPSTTTLAYSLSGDIVTTYTIQ